MPTARSTLVLAGAFVLVAAAFDQPSLYVPGLALAAMVAGLRTWVALASRSVRAEGQPGPWSIVEGERYPLAVRIRSGGLPLPGGRIVHPLATHPLSLAKRSSEAVRLELRSLRRGRRRIEPATVLLSDPIGLHTARVAGGQAHWVLVLPRIEPVLKCEQRGGTGEGALTGPEGYLGAGLGTRAIDFEIDGLRPYRHGSSASRIHWPTVARTGEMVEHRVVAGGDSSPLVVLDRSRPVNEEALDAAVRAAASIGLHLARDGGCRVLVSGERQPLEIDPQLRAWPQVHAHLAVVEAGGRSPAVERLSRAETLFWVSAAQEPPTWARGGTRSGWYLVTPFPLRDVASVFTVAGCHAQRPTIASRRAAARAA
jgi:uncharacterized protein (DUF58 family)